MSQSILDRSSRNRRTRASCADGSASFSRPLRDNAQSFDDGKREGALTSICFLGCENLLHSFIFVVFFPRWNTSGMVIGGIVSKGIRFQAKSGDLSCTMVALKPRERLHPYSLTNWSPHGNRCTTTCPSLFQVKHMRRGGTGLQNTSLRNHAPAHRWRGGEGPI